MRRDAQQPAPFGARLEHQMQMTVLEVAQTAVNEPRRAARGAAREIGLLDERDIQSAQRRIARDAASGDAAADHQDVEGPRAERGDALRSRADRIRSRHGANLQCRVSSV